MKGYAVVRALGSFVGQSKLAFASVAGLFILSGIPLAIAPWVIGQLIQSLANHQDVSWWLAAAIATSIGHDVLWRAAEITFLFHVYNRLQRFDDKVFSAVISHRYSYFVDNFTGKVSSYATGLGRDFRTLLDETFNDYIHIPVFMPILVATMFTVNVYTGVIFIVSLLLMFITGRYTIKAAATAERVETDKRSTIDGQVVDSIANFATIKSFGSESRESKRLYRKRTALIAAGRHSQVKSIIFWTTMSIFVRWMIWPLTFALNVYLYQQGSLNIAQVTTFAAVIVLFSNYIWEVIWGLSQITIKLANMEESYRYLFGDTNIFRQPIGGQIKQQQSFQSHLELRGLSFAYPDKPGADVLHNIDLKIARGEKIGLVGVSGSGKSTLMKLLLGHYPAPDGQLLLDTLPIDNRSLVDLTAYVPQDTTIFHRSIRENIAYAKPDASDSEVRAAAQHAQADGFIAQLDTGYDTLVGERGVKLSGGQRQRIAIARALLKDAPLLLLDEATSALDSESEQYIQAALQKLMHGRTAIVIAHRLSTIQHMDRIVVLDDGKIIEEGSHQQLLSQQGTYAKLWAHQSGGFITE